MLVALLFALHENEEAKVDEKPHLWVLNARALNEVTHYSYYLEHPLKSTSKPEKPYIWYPDSFPTALRAEQVRGRVPNQWFRVLKHVHPSSRGYPSDYILDGCDLNLKQSQQKGCQRYLFFAKTVSIFEPLKLMPVNLKCQPRRVVSSACRQDKIAVL